MERFYIEADYENGSYPAVLYNKEPHLEKREAAAAKALKKKGYVLEKTSYYNGMYRHKNYYIKKKKEIIYVGGEYDFSLEEIERILADNYLEN